MWQDVTSSYILCHIIMHTMSHHHTGRLSFYLYIDSAHVRERELPKRPIHTSKEAYLCAKRGPQKKNGSRTYDRLSHHHTYYVTSSYILCHIIIHTMSHLAPVTGCHIIIHTMSHHHTYYVASSYILCHISHLWQAGAPALAGVTYRWHKKKNSEIVSVLVQREWVISWYSLNNHYRMCSLTIECVLFLESGLFCGTPWITTVECVLLL